MGTPDHCVMIAIGYENQDANLSGSVNRVTIRYNFHTVITPIRYSVSIILIQLLTAYSSSSSKEVFRNIHSMLSRRVSLMKYELALQPQLSSRKFRSSSLPEVFCVERVFENFAKFMGKDPCQSLTRQCLQLYEAIESGTAVFL